MITRDDLERIREHAKALADYITYLIDREKTTTDPPDDTGAPAPRLRRV